MKPTNNVAERTGWPAVLWREGSFDSASEAGSRFAERLLTAVASRPQQGRPLLTFLVSGVEATVRIGSPPSLLPLIASLRTHLSLHAALPSWPACYIHWWRHRLDRSIPERRPFGLVTAAGSPNTESEAAAGPTAHAGTGMESIGPSGCALGPPAHLQP